MDFFFLSSYNQGSTKYTCIGRRGDFIIMFVLRMAGCFNIVRIIINGQIRATGFEKKSIDI